MDAFSNSEMIGKKIFGSAAGSLRAMASGTSLLRPTDRGIPYDEYFSALNDELKRNGPMRPCMVIDLDRLDHNLDLVMQQLGKSRKRLRIVEKSLPSFSLIDYVAKRSGTKMLMSFHQPFLNIDAERFPDFDILLGKPLPVASAALFYRTLKGPFDPSIQLQWLLDTAERLRQYLELAKDLGTKMRVCIELDVGLHRGGVKDNAALDRMMDLLVAHPEHLEFAGFMGYDGHVGPSRKFGDSPDRLLQSVMKNYQDFIDHARRSYQGLWNERLTFNTGGSLSYTLHENEMLSNEISIGKVFLKPKRGDIPALSTHLPAVFIAAPVIKTTGAMKIPSLNLASRFFSWWDVNQRETFYLYGGNWGAVYESPKGLQFNAILGRSSNHEHVSGSSSVALKVDDHVFFRPTSTEGIMLQFGDLITLRGGKIFEYWPVYQQTG